MFQHPDRGNMGIEQERYPLSKSNRQIPKLPNLWCQHVCDVISGSINNKDEHEVGEPCIMGSISEQWNW